jgi:Protein of unknown function (DUF2442)
MADRKARIATDAEIDAAMARVRSEIDDAPSAVAVKYIAGYDIYIVSLDDGSRMVLQRERLQGLQNATKQQLSNVEILGRGTGLHWRDLDVDLYIPALRKGIFGNKHWMKEMGRIGGRVTSEAKARSSRLNGTKGGRPKKYQIVKSEAHKSSPGQLMRGAAKKAGRTGALQPAH